jgi:hypothetical protein
VGTDDTAASKHGADAETAHVPSPPADEPELAWSVDDITEETSTTEHGRLVWAGLAALVVAVATALAILISALLDRNATNNARPQPVPPPAANSTVAAAPPTASVVPSPTATPPAPVPSAASVSQFASLLGEWEGHERSFTVSADGTTELEILDIPACPSCSFAQMPYATIHIGLTSYDASADGTPDGSGKFFGYVKDSSDSRVIPATVPVEVDVMKASDYTYPGGSADPSLPGRVVTVSISGTSGAQNGLGALDPFCDEAAASKSVCGA